MHQEHRNHLRYDRLFYVSPVTWEWYRNICNVLVVHWMNPVFSPVLISSPSHVITFFLSLWAIGSRPLKKFIQVIKAARVPKKTRRNHPRRSTERACTRNKRFAFTIPYGAWSNKSTPRSNGPQPRPVLWNARTVVTPGRTPKKLHLYINQKNVLIHLNTLLSTMTDPIEIGKDHQ